MPKAVIVDAVRTAIGRFGGGLQEFSASDLATHLVKALIERNEVPVDEVDEVIFGHVLQGGAGGNVGRRPAMGSRSPQSAREPLAGPQEFRLFQTEVVIRAHGTRTRTEKEAVQYDPLTLLPRRRHAEPYVGEALGDVHIQGNRECG